MSEQDKFEAWYIKTNQSNINNSCWRIGGFYTDRVVQRSWEAWQAAKVEAVPEGSIVVNNGDYVELRRVNRVRQQQIIELSETVKILRARRDYYKRAYKTTLGTQERENGC